MGPWKWSSERMVGLGRLVFLTRKTCINHRFSSFAQSSGFGVAEAFNDWCPGWEGDGGHGCEPPARSNFICFVFGVSFFKNVSPAWEEKGWKSFY